jgi:hypothetical protein
MGELEQINSSSNKAGLPTRKAGLPPFVLDSLRNAGYELIELHLNEYETRAKRCQLDKPDADLLHPYMQANADNIYDNLPPDVKIPLLKQLKKELRKVEQFVEDIREEFNSLPRSSSGSSSNLSPQKKKGKGSKKSVDDPYINLAKKFQRGPQDASDTPLLRQNAQLEAVMASYAYKLSPKSKFSWSVAQRTLCDIKARSQGHFSVNWEMGSKMTINSTLVKSLKRLQDGD